MNELIALAALLQLLLNSGNVIFRKESLSLQSKKKLFIALYVLFSFWNGFFEYAVWIKIGIGQIEIFWNVQIRLYCRIIYVQFLWDSWRFMSRWEQLSHQYYTHRGRAQCAISKFKRTINEEIIIQTAHKILLAIVKRDLYVHIYTYSWFYNLSLDHVTSRTQFP